MFGIRASVGIAVSVRAPDVARTNLPTVGHAAGAISTEKPLPAVGGFG